MLLWQKAVCNLRKFYKDTTPAQYFTGSIGYFALREYD